VLGPDSVVRTPESVQGIAFGVLFPLTFLASTLRSVAHPAAYTLIWIAGIIAICAPLAIRAYRRSVAK
jgi:hypothetical protein